MNDVFPLESITEMKLGLDSVDSGASVIVLVVVPVNDTCGAFSTALLVGGDAAWLEGLAAGASVAPEVPLGFPTAVDWVLLTAPVLELALSTAETSTEDFAEAGAAEGEGELGAVETTATFVVSPGRLGGRATLLNNEQDEGSYIVGLRTRTTASEEQARWSPWICW